MTILQLEAAIQTWFAGLTGIPVANVWLAQQSAPRDDAAIFATFYIPEIRGYGMDAPVPSDGTYEIQVNSFLPSQAYTLKVNGVNHTYTTGVTVETPTQVATAVAAAVAVDTAVDSTSAADIVDLAPVAEDTSLSVFVVAGPMSIISGDGQDIEGDRIFTVSLQVYGLGCKQFMLNALNRHRAETYSQPLWDVGLSLFDFKQLSDSSLPLDGSEWEERAIAVATLAFRSTVYDPTGTIETVELEATVENELGEVVLTETVTIGV